MTINTVKSLGMFGAGLSAGTAIMNISNANFEPQTTLSLTGAATIMGAIGYILGRWKCKPLEDDTAFMELANKAVQEVKRPENLPRLLYTLAGVALSPATTALFFN